MLENSILALAAVFCGGDEAAAAETLRKKGDCADDWLGGQLAYAPLPEHLCDELFGTPFGAMERLKRARQQRARYLHDEWAVYLWEDAASFRATVGATGIQRKGGAKRHHLHDDGPDEIWALAREIRELHQLFDYVADRLRDVAGRVLGLHR